MKDSRYIPARIRYVISHYAYSTECSGKSAFPVDPDKEKTVETARKWAGAKYKEVEVDNNPISDVEIISLEERGNGGRAYKVLVHGKYVVDLREDCVLDAIREHRIEKGIIYGMQFVWMKYGANIKLIEYNSVEYNIVKANSSAPKVTKVPAYKLVPGMIYSNNKSDYVFLGFVNAADTITDWEVVGNKTIGDTRLSLKWDKPSKHQLWLERYNISSKDDLDSIIDKEIKNNFITFHVTKSKTVYLPKTIQSKPFDVTGKVDKIRDAYDDYVNNKSNVDRFSWTSLNSALLNMNLHPNKAKLEDSILERCDYLEKQRRRRW